MRISHRFKHTGLLAIAVGWAISADAIILNTEDFSSDPGAGWSTRDSEMDVGWDNGEGNPSGSLGGLFEEQDEPFFQSDAFRITDAAWVGDYNALYSGFTQFSFDFLAADVLPSTFIIRIGDGSTTFIRNLLPQVGASGIWLPGISVSLAYDASWLGGNSTDFDTVMANVTFVDIQVGRNGTAAQQYFIDNFSIMDDALDNGGGGDPMSAVPEPFTLSFMATGFFMLYAIRRRVSPA